jgi:hypothetical protein
MTLVGSSTVMIGLKAHGRRMTLVDRSNDRIDSYV